MPNDIDIAWISSIEKKNEVGHLFFKPYVKPANMPMISRNGLYLNCWEKFSKNYSFQKCILHDVHSSFLNDETLFFKLEAKENSYEKTNLLIVFLLDPWIMPIHSLKDSLLQLSLSVDLKNVNLYSITASFSAFSPARHLDYLNSFYQTISNFLGLIPKNIEILDLQKMSTMKNWNVYEAGTIWLCSDNYITHLSLSKGASLISYYEESNVSKTTTFSLSRYHSLEVGFLEKRNENDIFKMYRELQEDELSRSAFSELKVPDVFMSLIYKRLGNQ